MSAPTRTSRLRRAHTLSALVASIAAAVSLDAAPVLASHVLVTNLNDSFAGSLRQAVTDAAFRDSILFDPATWGGTITLSSGSIAITQDLEIVGPQKGLITIAASGTNRIFDVSSGQLALSGLTLTNPGSSPGADFGGLIAVNNASTRLVLTDCDLTHVTNNGLGGLIFNGGILTATRCRLSQGSAGVNNGGAIYSDGTLIATDCLFDSCSAGIGGALMGLGKFRLVRCTLTGNQASQGAAIRLLAGADSTTLLECTVAGNAGAGVAVSDGGAVTVDVGNTIIAANSGGDVSGGFHSLGFNAIGNGTGSTGFGGAGSHDQVGTSGVPFNPGLLALAGNGGATLTMAPGTGSLVIDRGHAMAGTVDARGHARPYDDPGVANVSGGDGTDVGAVEKGPRTHWLVTNLLDHGPGSLRQAVLTAAPGDSVTFDPSVGGTIRLTSGEIVVPSGFDVFGPGPNVLILDGGGVRPVLALKFNFPGTRLNGLALTHGAGTAGLDVGAGVAVTADLLAVTDCRTTGIRNAGSLVVQRSLIARCNAAAPGATGGSTGGAIFNAGSLVVIACTLTADTALVGGGIANSNSPASIEVRSSTIVNNVTFGLLSNSRKGGGIINAGLAFLASTLVAGNKAELGGPDLFGSFISHNDNLVGIADGSSGLGGVSNHDQLGTAAVPLNPMLGPLADNGGPTPTLLPLAGSPAIDQGFSNGFTTDQRELARVFDDPAVANVTGGDGADVGACERDAEAVDVAPGPPAAGTAVAIDRIDAVAPNPARGAWNVRFTLARSGAADLALFDVAGRRVATLAHGPLTAGGHALAVPAATEGVRLRAGVYWLRLATPAGASAQRLVRLD